MEETHVATTPDLQRAVSKRFDELAWALFLILIGAIWLLPAETVPEGTWLVGAGLILLGMSAARALKGIKVSGFAIALGILAIVAGLGHLVGVKVPVFAILFILIGASIILRPLVEGKRNKLRFGSHETRSR
jgi:cytosine/uracil/thiamine/allantoin permease